MAKKIPRAIGDEAPVTGAVALPSRLVAAFPADNDVPDDDLGRLAYWLLRMNPEAVSLKFRKSDLSAMDDETKRLLVADIQHALGVVPLKGEVL